MRSGGNKVHGVHVRQCSDFGGLHQFVHSQDASDTTGIDLAVGGIVTAAVCIAVTCKEAVVLRDGLDGW